MLQPVVAGLARLRTIWARRRPLDWNADVANAVLIAGVGRSGTTWLADLINFDHRYRDLFEPFHAWKIPGAAVLKGHWYQPPGSTPPAEVADYIHRVLTGRMHSPWSNRFNHAVLARHRLIKTIRANLMLGWLATRYPTLRIILLIRHPAAVADSRLRLHAGWQWRPSLTELLAEAGLVAEHLGPYRTLLAEPRDPFEETVLSWCICHHVPFRELMPGRVLPVFYEHLVAAPEVQLRRVFDHIGQDWDDDCLERHDRPSRTARETGKGEHTVARWRKTLSDKQTDWMDATLRQFGLDHLYDPFGQPAVRDEGELFVASWHAVIDTV